MTPFVNKTIATSLVSSRLDYCNFLSYNISLTYITDLQGVQTCLCCWQHWKVKSVFRNVFALINSSHVLHN